MTNIVRVSIAIAAINALLALPRTASAQSGSVSAVAVQADHRLLGSRLLGADVRVDAPLDGEALNLRLGAERVSGSSRRTGIPCGGMIQPDTCAPEPLRDDATLTTGIVGLGLRVLRTRQFALELTGDVRAGLVRAQTLGLTSRQEISASKTMWGGELGADGSWRPWARLPIALELSVAIGGLIPVTSDQMQDAYTPFDGGLSVRRVRVGVSWAPSSR